MRPDIIRDKNSLKRATLNFISSIVMNHLSSLLITESNKQELPEIIGKVFEYSYDLSDTTTSKLAIVQLTNFVNVLVEVGVNWMTKRISTVKIYHQSKV